MLSMPSGFDFRFKKVVEAMDADLRRWQARMAPLMTTAVVLTGLFFAIATMWKFGEVEARLNRSSPDLPAATWNTIIAPQNFDQQMQLATIQASYDLERELVARRYEQGNLAFMSRLWTRFMGFVTGMILGLVGAAFVLGKLDTDQSEVEAAVKGMSLTMRSTSPGLLLATLGTLLMGLSIALPVDVSIQDAAVYFVRPAAYIDGPPIISAAPSNEDEPPLRHPDGK